MRATRSLEDRETIIIFNESREPAHIFTYNKAWQKHLEKKLGLKPIKTNGHGAKEYEIDKKRIKPPRAPVKFSTETKAKMAKRARDMSRKRVLKPSATSQLVKSTTKNVNKGNGTRKGKNTPKKRHLLIESPKKDKSKDKQRVGTHQECLL